MKKILLIAVAAVISILLMNLFSQEFTYVGVAKCKICHKSDKRGKQFPIWEESKHSKSFMALTSEEVKAKVPDAPENPKCLKCHSPLFEKAPELKEEGVTCEVCHGPGSAYKKLSIMKSREESVKNGLIVYDSPEAIKTQCLTCHEMAHEKTFDFEAAWEKIKHPVPEKNKDI
jgi:hypothetical protein